MQAGWQSWAKAAGIAITFAVATVLVIATRWSHPASVSDRPVAAATKMTLSGARAVPKAAMAEPASSALIIPVAGVSPEDLVDTFTQARASGARRHDAIDILAPRGTPVIAAAPGTVEKLFLSKDGGNTVYIRSANARRLYYYAHLDRYAPGLTEGSAVSQGAPIGAVGSTGNADPAAPHLHFAIWMTSPERKWWEEALALNPYPLLHEPAN